MNESFSSLKKSGGENENEAWLEEQFKNVETLDIEGHPLRIIDINPREAKSDVPVIIAPSYGSYSPDGKKVNILEMARQNRRTLYVDEPRGIDRNNEKENGAEIEEFFLRQTEALIAALDAKEIAMADVVATSEGCMYAAVVAALYPERIRNLVLVDPGGMIGDDSFVKLCYRFITEGANEIRRDKKAMSPEARKQARGGDSGFVKYLTEDIKMSIQELRSMAKQQIRSLLKQAHKNGVGISIIHGVNDKVFPMKRVQEQTSRTAEEKELGEDLMVDGFYSVKGGHGEFLFDPERFTRIADEALTALEKKREKYEADVDR